MPIFSLKKYSPIEENKETNAQENTENTPKPEEKSIFIKADDTIAEVVVKTLYETFGEKNVNIETNNVKPDIEVISSESINKDMVNVYKNISSENIYIILDKPSFNTIAEEWFLTNTKNKNIIYSNNQFIEFIRKL